MTETPATEVTTKSGCPLPSRSSTPIAGQLTRPYRATMHPRSPAHRPPPDGPSEPATAAKSALPMRRRSTTATSVAPARTLGERAVLVDPGFGLERHVAGIGQRKLAAGEHDVEIAIRVDITQCTAALRRTAPSSVTKLSGPVPIAFDATNAVARPGNRLGGPRRRAPRQRRPRHHRAGCPTARAHRCAGRSARPHRCRRSRPRTRLRVSPVRKVRRRVDGIQRCIRPDGRSASNLISVPRGTGPVRRADRRSAGPARLGSFALLAAREIAPCA